MSDFIRITTKRDDKLLAAGATAIAGGGWLLTVKDMLTDDLLAFDTLYAATNIELVSTLWKMLGDHI